MASSDVNHRWKATTLNSIEQILDTLAHLRVHRWITRGQSKCFGELFPKIDRYPLDKIVDRTKKIKIERQSIELFRSNARFFASSDEQAAMRTDIPTLMVLQHYGVPTRLLDWTQSPYVAVYFSICKDQSDDGELWSFDYDRAVT
jgi:FRG domain